MEKKDFVIKLYEYFGIPCSNILWIPEKFTDTIQNNELTMIDDISDHLKKSNGDAIDDKMIESIKKMIFLVKSVDNIAFFYNIPIATINKIIRDH